MLYEAPIMQHQIVNEALVTLYKWYMKENEEHIYLILAALLCVTPDPQILNISEGDIDYTAVWANAMKPFDMPDWAVDKHTREGRKAGMTAAEFATEGAYVENEWCPYPELGLAYIAVRLSLAKSESSTALASPLHTAPPPAPLPANVTVRRRVTHKLLTEEQVIQLQDPKTPRGQLLTSPSKQPVYLPRAPCAEVLCGWVWKGPFAPDTSRLVMTRWRTECFRFMGSAVNAPEFMPDYAGNIWLRFPSLATASPDKWVVSMKRGSCEDFDVAVVERKSTGALQLIECKELMQAKAMFEPRRLILSLIDAAMLCTGDMGMWNIIGNAKGEVKIVDYTDTSHRESITQWSHLFAKGGEKVDRLFDNGVPGFQGKIREHIALRRTQIHVLEAITTRNKLAPYFKRLKVIWDPVAALDQIEELLDRTVEKE